MVFVCSLVSSHVDVFVAHAYLAREGVWWPSTFVVRVMKCQISPFDYAFHVPVRGKGKHGNAKSRLTARTPTATKHDNKVGRLLL